MGFVFALQIQPNKVKHLDFKSKWQKKWRGKTNWSYLMLI